ncbi:GcrA family cell cycle regulator [Roseomonas sp. CCTCC AB2023176]|uniref:GcrA family cell cycle regulator n=1 Tax=Roseomonas sp. CCTCC AB2023176 TaxID=3342640 RepID=UPI0035E002FC
MDWTNEAIETLKALWAEGHSTAEIGRRMGISKNAVVGKAHRLHLAARPSPIQREDRPAPVVTAAPEAVAPAPRVERPAPAPRAIAPRAPAAPPTAVVRPFQRLGTRTCCWPIGEPGDASFRFCGAEALAPKPYCAEHAAIAYVKARDRREDAA